MTSHRKMSGKERAEHEDPPPYNIRFDYSDTYLDNEDLDLQLEDQADELHREKYRMCVESDEMLKKTKQNADEMLQLKNAIKNRDPYESSNRVVKSADLKRRASSKQVNISASATNEDVSIDTPGIKLDADEIDGTEQETETEETEKKLESKPLNTLTMFLISLQTFKRHGHQRKEEVHKKSQTHGQSHAADLHSKSNTDHGQHSKAGRQHTLNMKRPSSYHHDERDTSETARDRQVMEKKEESQYGIHVKTDFTRSRRKLEEISKLEQDSKYGYVNRYEERRKKLLAASKDTKNVDERIKVFLKDVEEFKLMSSADNSLEKVLMRSKSARFARSNTFAW